MNLVSLEGYNRIYATDSFWDDYRKLFGKDGHTYEQEKKILLTNLQMLDTRPLHELLQIPQKFEHLTNEDLYVIRHVSKTNPRVVFVTSDEDGNFVLLNSFLEKGRGDYEIGKARARGIVKLLEEVDS